MSHWRVTGAGFYNLQGEAVYTVTNGCKRLDHRDHDELGKLLNDAEAIRETLTCIAEVAEGSPQTNNMQAIANKARAALSK